MREIYLDNAATTRTDDDIARYACGIMTEEYGNPSSLHQRGLAAERLLTRARGQVAAALGAAAKEIVFCSGGTEANNLALCGAAAAHHRRGKTIVTTAVEHASVLETARHLENQGFRVILVPPASDGSADTGAVLAAIDEDTILVSCMAVNSETGAFTDVKALAAAVKRRSPNALFHTDAVQAFGKLPLSVRGSSIDLLTLSAHKLHAPKGAGALYLRRGARILPLLHGGGQEGGMRSGTQGTPLCCALGMAAERAAGDLKKNLAHAAALAMYFSERAQNTAGVCINSAPNGTPYIQSISVPGYRSEILLHDLEARGISVSNGSACHKGEKSHVLAAMGLPAGHIDSALRVSTSRYNEISDIDAFFEALSIAMRERSHL